MDMLIKEPYLIYLPTLSKAALHQPVFGKKDRDNITNPAHIRIFSQITWTVDFLLISCIGDCNQNFSSFIAFQQMQDRRSRFGHIIRFFLSVSLSLSLFLSQFFFSLPLLIGNTAWASIQLREKIMRPELERSPSFISRVLIASVPCMKNAHRDVYRDEGLVVKKIDDLHKEISGATMMSSDSDSCTPRSTSAVELTYHEETLMALDPTESADFSSCEVGHTYYLDCRSYCLLRPSPVGGYMSLPSIYLPS